MPDLIRHPARSDTPSGAKSVPFAPDASTPNGIRDVMPEERQPCIYIMASDRLGTLYIGVTSNLMRRLAQHRSGALDGFTARHQVKRLVFYELYGDMERAIAREKRLKSWRRDWKIALIQTLNPDWHDLAPGLGFAPLSASAPNG
jgi:putative endonuclease